MEQEVTSQPEIVFFLSPIIHGYELNNWIFWIAVVDLDVVLF